MAENGGPTICSLSEHQVNLSDEVRRMLAHQLQNLYNGDISSKEEAERHIDQILYAMKTPPATTTCRVNLIRSTRSQVEEGLQKEIETWISQRGPPRPEDSPVALPKNFVRPHPLFEDVVCVGGMIDLNYEQRDGGSSLVSCRIPPSSKSSAESCVFKNWPTRAQKGWPLTHRVIVCDRFCGEAVLRGSDIFVRGVLSADTGIRPGENIAVYADVRPSGVRSVTRGLVLEKYTGPCVFLGIGIACCSRGDMFTNARGLAVRMSSRPQDRAGPVLPPLSGVLSGMFMLQNLPSIVVGHALDPKVGDFIIDMCCAPGGKTSHLASLVRNNATIIGCDKSRKKVVTARDFFREMGATCVTPLAWDSTSCVVRDGSETKSVQEVLSNASVSQKDGLLNIKAFYPETFDRVLLDPPCSALGLRPKLVIDPTKASELEKHAAYQRFLVKEAVSLLKPGGTMTYSTCTTNAAENEELVRYILDEYPSIKLEPITIDIGLPGLPGMGLTDTERQYVRRFEPSGVADTMGFFVSKFRKSCF